MSIHVTSYVELEDGRELKVEAEARVGKYYPGVSSGPVEACYPPEGGEVEFERIVVLGLGPSAGPLLNDESFDESEFEALFGADAFSALEDEAFHRGQEPPERDYEWDCDR